MESQPGLPPLIQIPDPTYLVVGTVDIREQCRYIHGDFEWMRKPMTRTLGLHLGGRTTNSSFCQSVPGAAEAVTVAGDLQDKWL
jgi:hypothetical protein